MDKNVHFVDYCIFDNEEKVYDVKFINEDILCSCDIGGLLKYNKITKEGTVLSSKQIDCMKLADSSVFSIDNLFEMTLAGMENGLFSIIKQKKSIFSSSTPQSKSISKCKFISESLIAVGDDTGKVFIYDIRTKSKPQASFSEQSEEISDIAYSPSQSAHLLSTSIDGTLCVYDIRKLKLYALSDCIEEEINCLQIVKDGGKVACGTGEGNIALFNWDWFGDYKDRIVGHPEGVHSMEKYNDNVVLTGCEDGGIRINTIFPKSIRGIISERREVKIKNKEFSDVSALSINEEEGGLLASVCNINYVKVYDISMIDFKGIDSKGSEDEEREENENEDREQSQQVVGDNERDNYDGQNDQRKPRKRAKGQGDEEFEEVDDDEKEADNDNEEENEEKEEEEIDEKDDNSYKKKGTSKSKHKEMNNSDLSIEENKKDKQSSAEAEDNSDSDFSSSQKNKKSKKPLSLGNKRYSEAIISKEKRKEFFNDL